MGNLLWPILVVVVTLVALIIFWRREINGPQLVSTPLPPYDIPDVILVGGVVVENRGHAPAPNVKVAIEYDRGDSYTIHHMHVASDEPYILRGGGEQYNFATIRLRELGPGKKLVVYWAAADRVQPRVDVTSFQPSYGYLFANRQPVWLEFLRGLARRVRR